MTARPVTAAADALLLALLGRSSRYFANSRSSVPRTLSPSVPSFRSVFSTSFGSISDGSSSLLARDRPLRAAEQPLRAADGQERAAARDRRPPSPGPP